MAFRPRMVVVSSGHMIDALDRATPRFPAAKAEAVRAEVGRRLEHWKVDERDLAICSGASGGDILFAEECIRRGAQLRLLLAQAADDFVRDSVANAGGDWVQRFHALATKAEVQTLVPSANDDVSIYARTNLWIIESARAAAADAAKICALLIWDEKPAGDGPGGTADFAARLRGLGAAVEIINPTLLA